MFKKKRNIKLLIKLSALLLVLCFCISRTANLHNNPKVKIDICNYALDYLEKLGIDDFNISQKNKQYNTFTIEYPDITITQAEINNYIQEDLESYTQFVDTKRKIIKKNDFICMSCQIYFNDKLLSSKQEALKVGSENFDPTIEQFLIGKKINTEYKINTKIPENNDVKYAGKDGHIIINVYSIQKIITQQLDNTFVKQHYNLNTVDEYYQLIKQKLYSEKEKTSQLQQEEKYIQKVIEMFEITLNEEQSAQYAAKRYKDYLNMAQSLGMSMEEFTTQIMGTSETQFEEECYEKSLEEIKEVLVIGAIAKERGIILSKEEISKYSTEDEHTQIQQYYELIRTKVIANIKSSH